MEDILKLYPDVKKQGIINLLRIKYKNSEIAYLTELQRIPNLCIICAKIAHFRSIFKGYDKTCGNHECKKALIRKETPLKLCRIKKFIIKSCIVCGDSFLVRDTKDSKNYCSKEICIKHHKKLLLKEKIIDDFLPYDFSYLNKLLYKLRLQNFTNCKIDSILIRNFLKNGIEEYNIILSNFKIKQLRSNLPISDFELTKDNKYFIYSKNLHFNFFMEKLYGKELINYYIKYYPYNVKKCIICKNFYIHTHIVPKSKLKSLHTCSLECYYKNFNFYITDERKEKQSNTMKVLIKSNEFTPNVFNSNTRKNIILMKNEMKFKFRSIWELVFYLTYIDFEILEYEKLRIEYIYENKTKIYIVDFVDNFNKIVFEIKPLCHTTNKINILKLNAAQIWCDNNNYIFKIISEDYFKNISYEKFLKLIEKNNFIVPDQKILLRIQTFLNNGISKS